MTTSPPANPSPPSPTTETCNGDGCTTLNPWLLHHVHHRTLFHRLCTSCVLRYHPGSFCSACFDIIDSTNRALARCTKCPAVAHLTCVPDLAASYLCPSCSSSHAFSYFHGDRCGGVIDLASAKVLVAAGRIAMASVKRAAAAARADAERKVKECVLAKRRASEMLERAMVICQREKEREKEREKGKELVEVVETKKKRRVGDAVSVMRKAQDRSREKWMRFNERVEMVPRSAVEQRIIKIDASADDKDRAVADSVKREEGEKKMKKLLLSSQDVTNGKEERSLTTEADKGLRSHQLTQDGSVSMANNGAILMAMPNTASLHS